MALTIIFQSGKNTANVIFVDLLPWKLGGNKKKRKEKRLSTVHKGPNTAWPWEYHAKQSAKVRMHI